MNLLGLFDAVQDMIAHTEFFFKHEYIVELHPDSNFFNEKLVILTRSYVV